MSITESAQMMSSVDVGFLSAYSCQLCLNLCLHAAPPRVFIFWASPLCVEGQAHVGRIWGTKKHGLNVKAKQSQENLNPSDRMDSPRRITSRRVELKADPGFLTSQPRHLTRHPNVSLDAAWLSLNGRRNNQSTSSPPHGCTITGHLGYFSFDCLWLKMTQL